MGRIYLARMRLRRPRLISRIAFAIGALNLGSVPPLDWWAVNGNAAISLPASSLAANSVSGALSLWAGAG